MIKFKCLRVETSVYHVWRQNATYHVAFCRHTCAKMPHSLFGRLKIRRTDRRSAAIFRWRKRIACLHALSAKFERLGLRVQPAPNPLTAAAAR